MQFNPTLVDHISPVLMLKLIVESLMYTESVNALILIILYQEDIHLQKCCL